MGVLALLAGGLMVVLRRRLSEFQVRSQNRVWGFQMGARSVDLSRAAITVVGVGLMLAGGLILAGLGGWR